MYGVICLGWVHGKHIPWNNSTIVYPSGAVSYLLTRHCPWDMFTLAGVSKTTKGILLVMEIWKVKKSLSYFQPNLLSPIKHRRGMNKGQVPNTCLQTTSRESLNYTRWAHKPLESYEPYLLHYLESKASMFPFWNGMKFYWCSPLIPSGSWRDLEVPCGVFVFVFEISLKLLAKKLCTSFNASVIDLKERLKWPT